MKVAVFGLGYVGSVSAACLSRRGHEVIGLDTDPKKVALIDAGRTPVLEPGLAELVSAEADAGRLSATMDAPAAVAASDVSIICVGTPSSSSGGLALDAIERVAHSIGAALPACAQRHTVVVRSTVLPGTTEQVVLPLLERESGLKAGADFGVAVNPEFLREGAAIADFEDPPKTVIGELDVASGDATAALYQTLSAQLFRVPLRVAEMTKYVDNAFHATKIAFANEIGALSLAFGVDSHEVMAPFLADRKLNISEAYLRPGFAFGGSCLPKDLRALVHAARHADVEVPLLESVLPSNARHLERTIEVVLSLGRRRVGLFGLAFKPGVDDLRESPLVALAEALHGKGYNLRIYDPAVSVSRLVGANREYMLEHLPHLSDLLMDDPRGVLEHAEVCIVAASSPEAVAATASAGDRHIVDLVRLPDAAKRRGEERYVGVAW
jgi:GDP-mannose 6-dehydrogenase